MKTLKNYLYNLSYQILVLILPLVVTPYISRVLEVDGTGRYSVAVAVANYFVLFGMLGVSSYGSRQTAYIRDSRQLLIKTFWEINIMRFMTMGTAILAYIAFVLITIPSENRVLYLIETITLVASLTDISWLFGGLEEFKKTATRNIIVKLSGVVLIFVFVKEKSDLWLYALIIAGTTLLGQLALWGALPKDFRKITFDFKAIKFHLKDTFRLWLPSIAIQIYTSLDKVMLGYLVNDTQAGLYENSQKIVKIATTVVTALSTVLVPKMANLFINGKKDMFGSVAEEAFGYVSLISFPLCFGCIAIKNTLVPWFYGKGYEPVSDLLLISSFLVITLGWSSILGHQVLVASKRESKYTISVTAGAVINVILNSLLIKRFEATGALIASVIAEYTGMLLMMYFSKDLISIKNCLRQTPKYLISAVIMCVGAFYIGEVIGYTLISTFIQIVCGVIIYFTLLFILRDRNFLSLLHKGTAILLKIVKKSN